MEFLNKTFFLDSIHKLNPHFNMDEINKAYDFCLYAHKDQKRKSGEPYAIHPIGVALEVGKLSLDEASIISALLHDVIEDTKYTKEDIEKLFGKEVANIVEGATKLEKIQFQEKQIRQVENFRKLFLALSKDVRVLIVKLCDRLHNMRTIEFQTAEKQKRIALETLEIYAPIAERVGLQQIKNELQDISFKILYPDVYADISKKIAKLEADFNTSHTIEDITREIAETMEKFNIPASIRGRKKMPYSIWKKMKKKNLNFEEVADIIAFRVIVGTEDDCYRALGAIHRTYNAIPGKFKDFISLPKSNGYKSLHTKIMGPKGRIVDIQIRTKAMHDEDEYGLASHWKYKQGLSAEDKKKYLRASWINRVLKILQESKINDVMHDAKIEIDERRVIAFTHSGEVIDLPHNATILDFTFALNVQMGLFFDYAVVNGQTVGINYIVKNGDKIDIKLASKPQVNTVWLNYTITGKARNEIIAYLSEDKNNKNNQQ